MIEPTAADEAGMAFQGPCEALATLLAYAEQIGATVVWRTDQRVDGAFVMMRYSTASQVRPAEQLFKAFSDGMFPGVEAFVLEPADDNLRRQMHGF